VPSNIFSFKLISYNKDTLN